MAQAGEDIGDPTPESQQDEDAAQIVEAVFTSDAGGMGKHRLERSWMWRLSQARAACTVGCAAARVRRLSFFVQCVC